MVGAVAAGGVIGACSRYELALAVPSRAGSFPLATFIVNVTGSFVLGLVLTVFLERWRPNEYLRPFMTTGVVGAYTTWSTFMVDADRLARAGRIGLAAGYVAASITGGLGAVYAGVVAAKFEWPGYSWRANHSSRKGYNSRKGN